MLPFSVKYRIQKTEETLEKGTELAIYNVDRTSALPFSVKLPGLEWSTEVNLNDPKNKFITILDTLNRELNLHYEHL